MSGTEYEPNLELTKRVPIMTIVEKMDCVIIAPQCCRRDTDNICQFKGAQKPRGHRKAVCAVY